MAAKKKLSFEEQLAALESLISAMESGSMPLEESMKRYEEGMKLADSLEKELHAAAQRLTVLRQNDAGEDVEVPMEEDEP